MTEQEPQIISREQYMYELDQAESHHIVKINDIIKTVEHIRNQRNEVLRDEDQGRRITFLNTDGHLTFKTEIKGGIGFRPIIRLEGEV